jgi:hypothetical protein
MAEKVAIISNVWTNMIALKKGEVHKGHAHTFDHTHLLSVGSVKLTIDGVESEFTAPTQIFIKRGLVHSMECLSEESLGTCIHVIRNGMRVEDIVDPRMLPSYSEDVSVLGKYADGSLVTPNRFMESEAVEWDDEDRPT